jgi:imidazolonepropionase-like amidohydrolase
MARKLFRAALGGCAAALFLTSPVQVGAQGQQALVIQGATLIDGNGGAPIEDSAIVVEGNRITAAGAAGQVQVPDGAQIIDGDGKWVVPGFWDCQVNYSWFYGELMLNQGVTSTCDIGNGEELSIVHREAVNAGKIRGPRTWIGIGHLGGADPEDLTGYETPLSTRQIPTTVEETRAVVRTLLDAGADQIMFHDGSNFTPATVAAGCEESHARNIPCTVRASGPQVGAAEAALAGADILPHARGVGPGVVRDGAQANNELDRFANMDEAKAQALIEILVGENVALVPNIIHEAPGYPAEWERMDAETREVLQNPSLRAYYPDAFYTETTRERTEVATGALRERRMAGYRNMLRFHKMFVDAGGKSLIGGDTNAGKVAGFVTHDEMEIFQEAGIAPMQILMAATSWVAEAMMKDEDYGTIEAGKIADMVILNSDPLQDIHNTRDIADVVFDGRIIDRSFHAYYSTPFLGQVDDIRAVEDLQWVRALKADTFNGGGGGANPPNPGESPQPAIETITPLVATQGDRATVTLTGFGFVAKTRVLFDGVSVPYRYVGPTELELELDEALLGRVGRFDIVVSNPPPLNRPYWGDGNSNKGHFLVDFRY